MFAERYIADPAGEVSALLLPPGDMVEPNRPEWAAFLAGWNDLPRDTWMGDGGTYRRRRYAAFDVAGDQCIRLAHRPHYQDLGHNPLNGGIERWFAPMCDAHAGSPLFLALLKDFAMHIARAESDCPDRWMMEVHQFRIEAQEGQSGQPTPEGMHCDGRDWVLVILMDGDNYAGGITEVRNLHGHCLLVHRLSHPGEALFLNDRTVLHGTSPIETIQQDKPAWRDTLVITAARARATANSNQFAHGFQQGMR